MLQTREPSYGGVERKAEASAREKSASIPALASTLAFGLPSKIRYLRSHPAFCLSSTPSLCYLSDLLGIISTLSLPASLSTHYLAAVVVVRWNRRQDPLLQKVPAT